MISEALLTTVNPAEAVNYLHNQIDVLEGELEQLDEKAEEVLTPEEKNRKIELEADLTQFKKDVKDLEIDPLEIDIELDKALIEGLKA
jgi:t-SNARE complex subunit (syntaxin)